jgi:uncharacterized protein (TIGR02217 family)
MQVFPSDKFAFETSKTMKNDIVSHRSGSGKRKSMSSRFYPAYEIKISLLGITQEEMETLAGFFAAVKGGPFLFRDFEDYAQYGVLLGAGDGVRTDFQLLRSLGGLFYEPVRDVIRHSLVVYAGDTRASITLLEGGIVRFASPPPLGVLVKADFEYYWRVAIDDDVGWQTVFFDLYKLPSIRLVTV